MWKHLASNALSLLIVALVCLGGLVSWGIRAYDEPGPLAQAICVRVDQGSNMRRVAANLAEQGAVASPQLLRIGADYQDRADQLKAGSFLVPERSSMSDIVGIVTGDGQSTCGTEVVYRIGVNAQSIQVRELDPADDSFAVVAEFDPATDEVPPQYEETSAEGDTRFRVALAEGVTSWQVVEALKAANFLSGEVDAVPDEGMLAPDSYEVAVGDDRETLLELMQDAQIERINSAWRGRDESVPYESPQEALIMASIVEKETGVPEERRQVASVFVNRLEQGMRLQTDPTVIYGLTEGRGVLGRGLRRSELQQRTPYNTYEIAGLPPTPIANPGLASIQAALNPDETDYFYFVADGTGGHAFAKTLAEHNENVARWRALEAEKAGQ